MRIFRTIGTSLLVAGAIIMLAAPAMAAEKRADSGKGSGDRIRTPDRTRIPGECKIIDSIDDARLLVMNGNGAGDGTGPLETLTCICIHGIDLCICGGDEGA